MCFYHMKKYDEEIYIFAANFNSQFLRNFRKTGARMTSSTRTSIRILTASHGVFLMQKCGR